MVHSVFGFTNLFDANHDLKWQYFVVYMISGDVKGSDIVHEAIVEAEVAQNAKHFFSQRENQIPKE